jgi:hypothetical protein
VSPVWIHKVNYKGIFHRAALLAMGITFAGVPPVNKYSSQRARAACFSIS